jgi:SAM-dependent methyltransferase
MPLRGRAHLQRDRAESFGAVARDYDRYRPSYPPALIADLLAARPKSALDVGCGTGKAAVLLAARGVAVLGVEVDPKMAAVARGHGLSVEVSTFEGWAARGRRFDLVLSAQAWHWVDPAVGPAKAADVLGPGGTLALFWNHLTDPPPDLRAALDAVYRTHAPEILETATGSQRRDDREYVADLRACGRFGRIDVRDYPVELTYSTDDWVGMVQTHSDHLALAPGRRAALVAALREAIDGLGGTVPVTGGTYTIFAQP